MCDHLEVFKSGYYDWHGRVPSKRVASRKRIASIMRLASIRGISRRRGYVVTTTRDKRQRPTPDLVKRQFVATDVNQLWVADMTYVPTWAGFLYLAVVTDVYSRLFGGLGVWCEHDG